MVPLSKARWCNNQKTSELYTVPRNKNVASHRLVVSHRPISNLHYTTSQKSKGFNFCAHLIWKWRKYITSTNFYHTTKYHIPKSSKHILNCFSALLLQIMEVLLLAAIHVEFWVTNEEVKQDVELHYISTGLYPVYETLQCGDSHFEVSELCQWFPTAK
jgi:hypothetical protein